MAITGNRWWIGLGLVGVFVFGAITGVIGAAGYLHHHLRSLHEDGPAAFHRLGVDWLDWELDLNAEQEVSVEEILTDLHLDLFRFKTAHNEELSAIVGAALVRIDAALEPEQMDAWHDIRGRITDHLAATFLDDTGEEGHPPGD